MSRGGGLAALAVAVLAVPVVAGCGVAASPSGNGAVTPVPSQTVTPTQTLSPAVTPTQTVSPAVTPTRTGTPTHSVTQTSSPPSPSPTPSSPTPPEPPQPTSLERGDQGPGVLALQQRLGELGYWLGSPDGDFGLLTEQAVFAIQGAAGLARDGVVGPRTRQALDDGVRPDPRSSSGHVIEIDRDGGLLIFADDGRPARVLHTSTGTFEDYWANGRALVADTPAGTWEVSWAHDGWRDGDLGRLYRPRYFHADGIAVHGYPSVPAYPASHGCARVTMSAMDMIWSEGLMPRGATVLVY